jgi:rhamnogalacturonan endolyase
MAAGVFRRGSSVIVVSRFNLTTAPTPTKKMKSKLHHLNRAAGITSSAAMAFGLAVGLLIPQQSRAAFGFTHSGGVYTVDSGAGLVFKVSDTTGDINSIKFNNGPELQDQSKGSHISSGLGTGTTVAATTIGGNTIKITLTQSPVTHYLVVRSGINNIYMATFITAEPSVGELRWITRLQSSQLSNVPVASDNRGNTGAIESSDVFGLSNGQTRSKYYGNQQAKDLAVRGVTGNNVGVFMAYGNRESSSGGPFFRDIQNQTGTDSEVYNYMNSGHEQTEANRINVLHGPYALLFTTGATPSVPDMSFMSTLGLTGWVSGRGTVHGTASGIDSGIAGYVGFANSTAQYWAPVSSGAYTCSNMKPGTYTATLYQGELAVKTASVSVTSGGNTTLNLASALSHPTTIWKIGIWDGTCKEFLNAPTSLLVAMHPQDVRMASWGPKTFAVGSASSGFPSVQFRGDNSPTTVTFTLTSGQVLAHTLRIGICSAYNNGRPSVVVNGHATTNPGASSQPNSRSVTIGTYRGNNTTFTYSIPASSFVSGANSLTITPISGSSDLSPWLSAGWSYDCVELDN